MSSLLKLFGYEESVVIGSTMETVLTEPFNDQSFRIDLKALEF